MLQHYAIDLKGCIKHDAKTLIMLTERIIDLHLPMLGIRNIVLN